MEKTTDPVDPVKYIRNLQEMLDKIRAQEIKAKKNKKKCNKKNSSHKFLGFESTLELPIAHQVCQKCEAIRLYGEEFCL